MNPFDAIEKIRRLSPTAANLTTDLLVRQLIPMARGTGVRVVHVSDRRVELTMPVNRHTKNHLGSLYFGAQMTLCDLAMGVLLFRKFPPGPYGGVIKRVEAEFKKKGQGLIRCICEIPDDALQTLEAVRSSAEGKAEAWCPGQLLSGDGELVTEFRVLVAIKRFGRPN